MIEYHFPPKKFIKANGNESESYATLNDGYSEIGLDDRCWVIYNGGNPTSHIFQEALEALKNLPNPHAQADREITLIDIEWIAVNKASELQGKHFYGEPWIDGDSIAFIMLESGTAEGGVEFRVVSIAESEFERFLSEYEVVPEEPWIKQKQKFKTFKRR